MLEGKLRQSRKEGAGKWRKAERMRPHRCGLTLENHCQGSLAVELTLDSSTGREIAPYMPLARRG